MARACLPIPHSLTGSHCSDTPAVLNDFAQQLSCAAAIMFHYIVLRLHRYPAGGLIQILFPDWSVTESHTETFRLCLSPAYLGITQNFPRGFNLPEAQTESYSTGVQLTVTQSLPIASVKTLITQPVFTKSKVVPVIWQSHRNTSLQAICSFSQTLNTILENILPLTFLCYSFYT